MFKAKDGELILVGKEKTVNTPIGDFTAHWCWYRELGVIISSWLDDEYLEEYEEVTDEEARNMDMEIYLTGVYDGMFA